MKTFIYLPFIALIILTGCKSSSFTTQRYTKLGHNSHKKAPTEVVLKEKAQSQAQQQEVVETEVVKSAEVKSSNNPVQLVASGISSLKKAIVKPGHKTKNVVADEENFVTVQGEGFSDGSAISSNSSKASVESQKTVNEKTQARGLIGSAFETAIWIVLVVIFVILIVFLLSVIF